MGTPIRYNTTYQHKRLTPTGRKAITRSRSRVRTSINLLSLAFTVEFRTSQSLNNCPRYPNDRISVVKHRQLPHQVGAFSRFVSKSSTDLDNMIFSMGSTFIFRSWICEVDDKGKLWGHLLEDQENQKDFTLSMRSIEELTKKLSRLAVSESTFANGQVQLRL
jgi:hypothetical protein